MTCASWPELCSSLPPPSLAWRTRSLIPAALQRNQLVTTLQSLLRDLGLKRRVREVPKLEDYIAAKAAEKENPGAEKEGGSTKNE